MQVKSCDEVAQARFPITEAIVSIPGDTTHVRTSTIWGHPENQNPVSILDMPRLSSRWTVSRILERLVPYFMRESGDPDLYKIMP